MSSTLISKVKYTNKLPSFGSLKSAHKKQFVVIFDRRLKKFSFFNKWISSFSNTIAVTAGENLKTLSQFEKITEKVLRGTSGVGPQKLCIVAVGGGSVGDFCGFMASTLKRGVSLIHIPSTWLAAVDSAHGGKTALNIGSMKNQIGSFYAADQVYMVKELLQTHRPKEAKSAYAELFKIALLEGGAFYNSMTNSRLNVEQKLWKFLPQAVKAKHKYVRRDPYEKKGERQLLNLGHTFAHGIELPLKLAHGEAVGLGLHFCLHWSYRQGIMSEKTYEQCRREISQQIPEGSRALRAKLSKKSFVNQLRQDKKAREDGQLNYIFLKRPGLPVKKQVHVEEILNEAKIQEWL